MTGRATVLIADDHPLVAQGLRALLRPTCTVAGVITDAREIESEIERLKPTLLLLDLSMPHRNGLELIPELSARFPALKIIVVTMHVERSLADLALEKGAHGFLPKEAPADELNEAIERVLGGDRYVSPRVPKRAYREASLRQTELDKLTPRQRQIVELIAQGKTTPQIAESLGVSPKTVEFHRHSIRRTLGLTSEFGLLRFAIVSRMEREGQ
jgi:DNA-binding NarL/FixJ family response regulator